MQSNALSGSNFSITTVVPPSDCTTMDQNDGAVWYSGAGLRYIALLVIPTAFISGIKMLGASSGGRCGSSRRMPLGRPVVPDEYCNTSPSSSSEIGVTGCPETHSG